MNYGFFILQIALIYILSRNNIIQLFRLGYFLFRRESLANFFVAMIFFPGTVIHEAAHAVMALILLMKVRAVELFPHKQGEGLRLGSVFYEKKDPIRAIVVGIAPFFAGMAFFWAVAYFNLFPNSSIWLSFIVGYLIFAVSSTMFSSKQDLRDLIIAAPILLIIGGFLYILFGFEWLMIFSPRIEAFLAYINMYLLFCLLIHIILLVIPKLLRLIIKL